MFPPSTTNPITGLKRPYLLKKNQGQHERFYRRNLQGKKRRPLTDEEVLERLEQLDTAREPFEDELLAKLTRKNRRKS